MTLMQRRRALMGQAGNEPIYDKYTGIWYPKKLNIIIDNSISQKLRYKYAYAQHLEEAIVSGYIGFGVSNGGENAFSNCPNLRKLYLPTQGSTSSNIAAGCPKLEKVILGSIGHPISSLYSRTFGESGGSVTGEKTITVYVNDSTTIPLASAPWGLTGATVIYRSATTGEIREVPSE